MVIDGEPSFVDFLIRILADPGGLSFGFVTANRIVLRKVAGEVGRELVPGGWSILLTVLSRKIM